jgi:hypothetical protein
MFVSLLLSFGDLITPLQGWRFQSCSGDQITAPAPWSSGHLESGEPVSHMMGVAEDAGSGSRRLLLHEGKTE